MSQLSSPGCTGQKTVRLGKDGYLRGTIRFEDGDASDFMAERGDEPEEPIPEPPSYRDKWRRRRR
jgi:hypothetical protein